MVYLIHSRRRPDASLNESAQSLSYTSGCPTFRVHRRLTNLPVKIIFKPSLTFHPLTSDLD